MEKSVEDKLREDIQKVSAKVTKLEISIIKEINVIQLSIESLKIKQNIGGWIFKSVIMIIVSGLSGMYCSYFRH
jgi:hypothetical protein